MDLRGPEGGEEWGGGEGKTVLACSLQLLCQTQ